MKFLVDAQLPKALALFLKSRGLDSVHTLELPRENKTPDADIAATANSEKRILVTKDLDFLQSHLLSRSPKKLLLVTTGNIHNKELLQIFDKNIFRICALFKRNSLIEIDAAAVTVHG